MKKAKITSLLMAIILVLTVVLASCTGNSGNSGKTESTGTSAETTSGAVTAKAKVNVMMLSGTTGYGMARLIDEQVNKRTELDYKFTVDNDPSNVTAALLNGSADIAALPTNAAAELYNKKNDSIQMLAINTLGVLYLVTGADTEIDSIADLRGKTVYCPAQNPTFVMKYICEANGLSIGTDVIIDNSYAQPKDLNQALIAGKVDIAVIPEPMVTVATGKKATLKVALDLTEEWDKVSTPGSLVQGCVVVRKAFADANPDVVATFLKEYEASVKFISENPTSGGPMIVAAGLADDWSVAATAIPNCNLCFIAGEDMKPALNKFFEALNSIAPASIGDAIPGDAFYYISK